MVWNVDLPHTNIQLSTVTHRDKTGQANYLVIQVPIIFFFLKVPSFLQTPKMMKGMMIQRMQKVTMKVMTLLSLMMEEILKIKMTAKVVDRLMLLPQYFLQGQSLCLEQIQVSTLQIENYYKKNKKYDHLVSINQFQSCNAHSMHMDMSPVQCKIELANNRITDSVRQLVVMSPSISFQESHRKKCSFP